jgi:hypothetical protein
MLLHGPVQPLDQVPQTTLSHQADLQRKGEHSSTWQYASVAKLWVHEEALSRCVPTSPLGGKQRQVSHSLPMQP